MEGIETSPGCLTRIEGKGKPSEQQMHDWKLQQREHGRANGKFLSLSDTLLDNWPFA